MLDSRRSFLAAATSAGVFAFLQQQPPTPIRPRSEPMPEHPEPAQKLPSGQPGKARTDNPAALIAHEKELRETTDRLLIKLQEFRAQLDGTHTAEVFSVNLYKQTEDIEKLAKLLRTRARP
jgi:hypothetical protein